MKFTILFTCSLQCQSFPYINTHPLKKVTERLHVYITNFYTNRHKLICKTYRIPETYMNILVHVYARPFLNE